MSGRFVPVAAPPLFRVPPFPGARPVVLTAPSAIDGVALSDADVDACIDAMRRCRVGGDYWGTQPPLPASPYILVRASAVADDALADLAADVPVLWWTDAPVPPDRIVHRVSGPCDPWHLLDGASAVLVEPDDELALLAGLAGVPVRSSVGLAAPLRTLLRAHVAAAYLDPFTGTPMSPTEAIALCGMWRALIDANRDIAGALGFAFWKQATVAPLLWAGAGPVRFLKAHDPVAPGRSLAVWKSRTPPDTLAALEQAGVRLIEVEDGFIRSAGLGADCVPPLSITVDRLGAHFDPTQASELERLLQDGNYPDDLVARAARLRALIVASGLSKYSAGEQSRPPVARATKKTILVPGQVEDDRSVRSGGGAVRTNLELLRRVRQEAPDARILYKPHPDVEAGHRVGAVPDDIAGRFADAVVRDRSIASLIADVDEVHVNTSLSGFEALLRGKTVVTHGVPFYAGWGLTRDRGDVPARRTARRTLDELVAAVLLVYPRYLDPGTGLPCPPEVLIRQLAGQVAPTRDVLVRLRRWQGRWKRRLASLRQAS